MMMEITERCHESLDGTVSTAKYSKCEKYRYILTREWDTSKKILAFVMLNPSTATEEQNDPTIERCERRARNGGYGGLYIYNIFAYRATDPRDMKSQDDPVGPCNDSFLSSLFFKMNLNMVDIICGWGTHGMFMGREDRIFEMMEDRKIIPKALEWTKNGHPKHPLYISYDKYPIVRPR